MVLFSQGGAGENDIRLDCFSRKVFAGTKDSAGCISPVRWPAAAECLTRQVRGRTLSRPLSATMYGKYDMPSMDFKKNCGRF